MTKQTVEKKLQSLQEYLDLKNSIAELNTLAAQAIHEKVSLKIRIEVRKTQEREPILDEDGSLRFGMGWGHNPYISYTERMRREIEKHEKANAPFHTVDSTEAVTLLSTLLDHKYRKLHQLKSKIQDL